MERLWWQLPGPARYVSRIVQDLRDGKNVILCLSEYPPFGLVSAIRSVLEGNDGGAWYTLYLDENLTEEPINLLFNRFVPERRFDTIRNVYTLSQASSFANGQVIWLDGMTSQVWPRWKPLLTDYNYVCRNLLPLSRTVFCVPLIGQQALDLPPEDVCLSHHYWRNTVSYFDMLLYTSSLVETKQISDVQKRLSITIIAKIALWDPAVSERLAEEKLERLATPMSILQEIAQERNWLGEESLSYSWADGTINIIDGREKIHSAALVWNDPHREIDRRVWSAEVEVILPFVEEMRQDLLIQLNGVLKVPFTTKSGDLIEDLYDLEIGHIEYQLNNNRPKVKSDILKVVRQLKEMRNCLSHLEKLSPILLSSECVKGYSPTYARPFQTRG